MPAKKPPQLPEAPRAPELIPEHRRKSRDIIMETVMRGGGEPFGAPFVASVQTLTTKVVARLKQKGFFSFETLEKTREAGAARPNKFTRYGAAPFMGELRKVPRK